MGYPNASRNLGRGVFDMKSGNDRPRPLRDPRHALVPFFSRMSLRTRLAIACQRFNPLASLPRLHVVMVFINVTAAAVGALSFLEIELGRR